MVNKKKSKLNLTSGEMELISFLWEHGELTLSEAHEKFTKPIGYTTMQTRLNRLSEKGLVHRSESRPAKYSAAVQPADVSANQLDVLLSRVTQGSVVPLVAQLIDDRSLSREDIDEIKEIIEQAEKRIDKGGTK